MPLGGVTTAGGGGRGGEEEEEEERGKELQALISATGCEVCIWGGMVGKYFSQE